MGRGSLDRMWRHSFVALIPAVLTACGMAYHALAFVACLRFGRRKSAVAEANLPVSILKPVRGRDPGFYDAIRSHALLEHPAGYEILFGLSDPDDPARHDIARLQAEFPALPIRVLPTTNQAPNGKAGSLEILAAAAKYPVIVQNDSDIRVPPEYLQHVVGLLLTENTGLVTCLYRGYATSTAARMECLGIATEFAPSVLVAEMLSASHFAFGSTLAMRASDLQAIGGFAAVQNYLADDYQIGARIAGLGRRVRLADMVVETSMGSGSWSDVWKHQLRWTRTIRVSNPGGYLGYVVTHLTFWSLLAGLAGFPELALAGLIFRLFSASAAMKAIGLRTPVWQVYLRDLFGAAVWACGVSGSTVEWRGTRYRLTRDGHLKSNL